MLLALLLAFTPPGTTPRHYSPPTDLGKAFIYVFDPYVNGASGGVPNLTPKDISACLASQAVGFSNDGGSLEAVCLSSTSQADVPTPPAAPASGATIFQYAVDSGFPSITATIDSFTGLLTPTGMYAPFLNYGTLSNWDVQCFWIQGWGTNTQLNYRGVSTGAAGTGSVGSPNWATTSLYTRSKAIQYSSSGAANSTAGFKSPTGLQQVWRGNSAGAGGFMVWMRASMDDTSANSRWAYGLFNTTAVLTATSDPNVATDSVYFGCNAGDTNLSICSNDNVSTATCTTLGANFPCTTDGAWYDFWFAASPNGSSIGFVINRLDSAQSAAGLVTSDLPRNTVQMNWHTWGNTGSGTTIVKLNFYGACYVGNF